MGSPLAIGAIPEAFLALLARSKTKGEAAYGALGWRQVGTLRFSENGKLEVDRALRKSSSDPTCLAVRERISAGMRMAGLPED